MLALKKSIIFKVPPDSQEYTIISQLLFLPKVTVLAVIIIMLIAIIRQGFTLKALRTIFITVVITGAVAVFGGIVITGAVSVIYSDWAVGLNSGVFIGLAIGIAAMIGSVAAVSGAGAVVGFAASSLKLLMLSKLEVLKLLKRLLIIHWLIFWSQRLKVGAMLSEIDFVRSLYLLS